MMNQMIDPAVPAVAFDKVNRRFGDVNAVDGVSLEVGQGEFVTLLGPSGSGKTTLLNLVAGSLQPDSGGIRINGADVTRVPPYKRNIGMVFQRYTLFPNKTVAENIAFPLEVRKLDRDEKARRVAAALKLVELTAQADRYPSQISGGQAQRVAVARALVFDPSLLLMDEPLGALDKSLRETLQEEIRRIQQDTKVPTIYVTHDQDEAMSMSDRIIICRDGRLVANGAPRALYERPTSLWAARFLGDVNTLPLRNVAPHSGGTTLVTLDFHDQPIMAQSNSGAAAGDLACVVRPERCNVAATAPAGLPAFAGTITDITFLGSRQRVDLRLDNGLALRALRPSSERVGKKGDAAAVWLDPDAVHLVRDDVERAVGSSIDGAVRAAMSE